MTDLPSIFNFYSLGQVRHYYASHAAVRLVGHDGIIACIELARSHETGAIRDYNADAFPADGVGEQLIILRAAREPVTLALTADELPILKAWLDSGSTYAVGLFPVDFLDNFAI